MSFLPGQKPRTSLPFIVHQADLMAARIEFEREWLPKLLGPKPENKSNFNLKKEDKKIPVKSKALGSVKSEGLNKDQLKNFIKERANQKLIELGYSTIYNDIDPNLLKQMEWFGHLTSGKTHQDFFAGRVTSYAKSTADWNDL